MIIGEKTIISKIIGGVLGTVIGGTPATAIGATLAFHAFAADDDGVFQNVLEGTTSSTYDSNTSTRYYPDFEGIYREFGSGEVGVQGLRVVRNICTYSEDFSNIAWLKASTTITTGITDPLGGTTAVTVTSGGVGSYIGQHMGVRHSINEVATNSIWIRRRTGTGTIEMYSGYGTSVTDITSAVTSSWQRVSTPPIESVAEVNDYIGIKFGTSGDEVDIAFAQLENTTSQSNQNPSEYVPTTSAPAYKIFDYENGNTVSSNVVTEAKGADITGDWGAVAQPALTNSCLYSRDLSSTTNWPNNGSSNVIATYDQDGLTGEPNTASFVEDDSATIAEGRRQTHTITADTETHTAICWIKKDSDEARFPEFHLRFSTSLAGDGVAVSINTKTGASVARVDTGGNSNWEVISSGGWWVVIASAPNTGSTSVSIGALPAAGNTLGALDVSATGSIIVGNVELHLNKTIAEVRGASPIFTTSSSATVNATDRAFDDANHSDTEGGYYLEWRPDFATSEASGDIEILSLNSSAGLLYYDATNSLLKSYDGTNTASVSLTLVAGTTYKLGLAYGSSKMRVGVDGTWGTEGTYDGAYTAGTEMESDTPAANARLTRDIRRYDASYSSAYTIVDGLISA